MKENMPDTSNKGSTVEPIYKSYVAEINCENMSDGLESSVIFYQINQPMNLQLWNGNFCPISLFEIDKYLKDNFKNIICSLLRIAVFIKQCLFIRKWNIQRYFSIF